MFLECHSNHEAYAPFLGIGTEIVYSSDIFHMDNLKYIMYSGYPFYVRFVFVHQMTLVFKSSFAVEFSGKIEKSTVVCVLFKERNVFVGKRSPKHVYANVLTPF